MKVFYVYNSLAHIYTYLPTIEQVPSLMVLGGFVQECL